MIDDILKIQQYWEERAQIAKLNPNATTDDIFLRELEIRTFIHALRKQNKEKIYLLDLGCGDGFTTIRIAKEFSNYHFLGLDYSENMISNAKLRLGNENDPKLNDRIEFKIGDATKVNQQFSNGTFDIVISLRCLINISSSKQQYNTIKQISKILKKKGVYMSSENFEDGNEELNKIRVKMGLPIIPIRWHNKFFNLSDYLKQTEELFKNVEILNFSSSYYYATRVIYSKYCQIKNIVPDYNHEIHKLSIDLPPMGNYSPIKFIIHNK
jgi:ubiquinone/menaquinone biosynthesis C-methylase UbiE